MRPAAKLRIGAACAEKIRRHAVQSYPNECCGALLGRDNETGLVREVLDVLSLPNRSEGLLRKRFSVSPRDVIAAEKLADERGLQIVGWYHSHPDHPAKPSEYDREHAWPWYSYLIIQVLNHEAREMTAWRLQENREAYAQEEIQEINE